MLECSSYLCGKEYSIDELFEYAIETALNTNIVKKGDRVIITGASAVGNAVTDTIKLHIL
jgi:pyruvate kinase